MRVLGIDYGTRKIGLALATSKIAEPLRVVRVKNDEDALKKVKRFVDEEKIELVVIGVSEGEMAEKTKNFGKKLEVLAKVSITFQDETLSTIEAQEKSFEAGLKQKKRKSLEDAYSATLILQSYLDENI